MALSTMFIRLLFFCGTMAAVSPTSNPVTSDPATSSSSKISTTKQPQVAATASPSLEFTCYSNGTISDILGVNKTDVVLLGGSSYCHLDESACIWKGKQMIHVLHVHGEKSSKIAGGKNSLFYQLECEIGGAFKASINASINIATPATQKYTTATMTPSPSTKSMSLTIRDKTNKAIATKVHIGDPLLLQITGPDGYTVDPIECSAISANIDYVLWKNETCASEDKAVFENDWKQNNISTNIITVQMYGFRFVDSDTVMIKCTALFCPTGVCSSHYCVKSPTQRRKRRNAGLETKSGNGYIEEQVSTYFTVVDNRMDTSASSGTLVSVCTYVTVFVLMFVLV